jgi:hypothetical protein
MDHRVFIDYRSADGSSYGALLYTHGHGKVDQVCSCW